MADTEEPQFNSLAERIAALNKQKNFSGTDATRKRPPPPAPPVRPPSKNAGDGSAANGSIASHHQPNPTVPPRPSRNNPPPLPRRDTQSSAVSASDVTNQHQGSRPTPPPLPSRTSSSTLPSPAQIPRRSSTQSGLLTARRNSGSSEISQHSTISSTSIGHASSASSYGSNGGAGQRKMAPAFDPTNLPPLPPTKRELEAKAKEAAAAEAAEKANWARDLPEAFSASQITVPACKIPESPDISRAIFTWFHHNIFYDTVAFFGNNVRHMSVEETIFSGKAVCQGYAETYKAIANRAGLECVVVGGHGKGFGHTALKKGEQPPPPKPDGHAWNAVRIDGGGWKLLDACWGAGHICGANNLYKQEFSPREFTSSNESFGLRHFPSNPSYQYRSDGRVVSWEEYFRGRVDGDPPVFYSNGHQEGIEEESVEPKEADIPVYSGQVVRFQFSKICKHWTSEKDGLGKPPLLLLSIHGVDGRKDEMVPIDTNGYWHWIDVNARDLGAPGQSVQVAMLTSIDGKDGRGVTAKEYLSKKGRVGMAWAYVLKWNLV
ncbi:kyphoscoliosis peptidase [Purpureocillium lavendulum]|uniref:Kyphoscoliosis peptidase n=1 Tax=Purpureocillium lavendulum TaxID=1247861 RepID=A0AB34G015_9HYPO|nr:kyphoscoliosis peptidase [Purpureocillium lavendulum]